jgi:two-component system, LuxR family, sensor kinase FixL
MNMSEKRYIPDTDSVFRLLAQQSRDAILVIRKSDGKILWANGSAPLVSGFTVAELLSMRLEDLRSTASSGTVATDLDQAFKHGRLFETMLRSRNGTLIPVEANSSGGMLGDEEVVVSIIRDLRERKEVQRELVRVVDRKCRSVGRKLHEGLSQNLSGIMFLIRSLRNTFEPDDNPESRFEVIEEKIRGLIVESKSLAHYLTLVESGEKGLVLGLETLASNIERIYSPRCQVYCSNSVHIDSDEIAQQLYYVAQESTAILLSHEQCDLIEINLLTDGSMIILDIADNGRLNNRIKYTDDAFHMIEMRARLFGGYVSYEEKDSRRRITCHMNPESVEKEIS